MAALLTEIAVLPTNVQTYETHKLNEIAQLLYLPESLGEADKNARILRALQLYEELKPEGAAEGMLAAQMVGTHTAALECLRRAAVPNQTFAGRDMALKHAQKLMTLYTQQLATLDKHRGKGQQKVTVEHVHVHSGGQAIVGSVETSAKRSLVSPQPALETSREIPIVPDAPRELAPKASRKRR